MLGSGCSHAWQKIQLMTQPAAEGEATSNSNLAVASVGCNQCMTRLMGASRRQAGQGRIGPTWTASQRVKKELIRQCRMDFSEHLSGHPPLLVFPFSFLPPIVPAPLFPLFLQEALSALSDAHSGTDCTSSAKCTVKLIDQVAPIRTISDESRPAGGTREETCIPAHLVLLACLSAASLTHFGHLDRRSHGRRSTGRERVWLQRPLDMDLLFLLSFSVSRRSTLRLR